MGTATQVALEIVGSLPDDCTLKDAARRFLSLAGSATGFPYPPVPPAVEPGPKLA